MPARFFGFWRGGLSSPERAASRARGRDVGLQRLDAGIVMNKIVGRSTMSFQMPVARWLAVSSPFSVQVPKLAQSATSGS